MRAEQAVRAGANHHLAHTALPYASTDELLGAAVPFLRRGLSSDDQAMVVSGEANLRLLRHALGTAARAVDFVDALHWYRNPARTLAAYDRYVKEQTGRGRRVWLLGEPYWAGRSPLEALEWKRYESLINVAFAGSGAHILCPYDTTALDPSIVADALRTHPSVHIGEQTRGNAAFVDPASFVAACDADPLPEPPPQAVAVEFSAIHDLGFIRRLVAEWATVSGLGDRRVPEAVLAVNEIASNMLVHGSGRGRLRVWLNDRTVLYQVSGDKPIHTPFPGHLPPSLDTERGRGLWLARQLCDLLEVRTTSNGSRFRLHFLLEA